MTRTTMGRRARRALTGVVLATSASACDSPDDGLRWAFGVERPAHVRIEHYDTAILNREGWDIWVMSPVDDAFLARTVTSARLARWQPGEPAVLGLSSGWPSWWPQDSIEALPEVYHREDGTGDWRVWVDRRQNRLYLQWFGT